MSDETEERDRIGFAAGIACLVLLSTLLAIIIGSVFVTAYERATTPQRWIGLDRSSVSCDYKLLGSTAVCIGNGARYECASDDGGIVWRCAATSRP